MVGILAQIVSAVMGPIFFEGPTSEIFIYCFNPAGVDALVSGIYLQVC